MGYSHYDSGRRTTRASVNQYDTKSAKELFANTRIHESLSPKGIRVREARDSATHPLSLPIIIALDVTGSMGKIPHELLKVGLPTMIETLLKHGLNDCAICFLAVGDHKSDSAPIQIAQFESGDVELDAHLQNIYLEGNGGGNGGESYFLAWYVAGKKTSTDAWEKRKQKGFVFTIGDEHCHPSIDGQSVSEIFGDPSEGSTSAQLLQEAQEKYHVFHLNLGDAEIQRSWKKLMGENNILLSDFRSIPEVIANKIIEIHGPSAAAPIKLNEEVSTPSAETIEDPIKITL